MGKPVILDRVYVGTLICFVTVTVREQALWICPDAHVSAQAVNIRIAFERPKLMRQTAGYLHVIACFIGGLGGSNIYASKGPAVC